jgi:hypothetical protein
MFPIVRGVLDYTEGINPDVLDVQLSSNGDGILKGAGEGREFDASLKGFHAGESCLDELRNAPTMGER